MQSSEETNPDPASRPDSSHDPAPDPGVRWMLAYQGGDEAAFDRLVEFYSGRVYALLTRFLGPVAAREDLVQETFLRVIRARARYQPTARFSTWLYRIVFNLCANEREKGSAVRTQALPNEPDARGPEWSDATAVDPSAAMERHDVVAAVRQAIAALPDQQRMALVLAKYDDLPYAEIAEVMNSSEKAIKSLIHRARESLRTALFPFLQGELA